MYPTYMLGLSHTQAGPMARMFSRGLKVDYEARVRFGTRVRVRVRVRDSAIFEKGGYGCGRTRRLKNY